MITHIEDYTKQIDRIVCLDYDEKDFLKLLIAHDVIPQEELATLFDLQHDYYGGSVGSLAEHLLMQKQAYLHMIDKYENAIAEYVATFFTDDLDDLFSEIKQ